MLNYMLPIAAAFLAALQLAKDWGAHQTTWRRVVVLSLIVLVGIGGALNNYYSGRKASKQHDDDQRRIAALKQAVDSANENQKINTEQFVDALGKVSQKVSDLQTRVRTEELQKQLAFVQDDLQNMQTGGDSFAFITFTAEPAQAFELHWQNFLAPKGKPYFLVSVNSHGKYPLRDTRATLMDDERRLAAMQAYNRNPNGDWIQAINSADSEYKIPYLRPQSPEAPTGEVDVLGIYPMTQSDTKRLSIAFSAPNGYWDEVIHLGRINGVWHQCLSVMGPTVTQAKHPFIHCDSDWPDGKTIAENDWKTVNRRATSQARDQPRK